MEWDDPNTRMTWMYTMWQFLFFLFTVVILMNLLIAMMADTYTSVAVRTPRRHS